MPKPENVEPHKFPEGQSGNPNGRPKGSRNRSTIAKKWLETQEKIKNPISGVEEQLSEEDIMTLALIKKARSGDTAAYRAVLDSAYGAPKQAIEHAGKDGVAMIVDYRRMTDEELQARMDELTRTGRATGD